MSAAALRVGLVGVGSRAYIGRLVGDHSDARLVVAADPRPAAAERARELFGADIAFTTDYRTLADTGLDAAIVTVPDDAHADVAEFLLRSGIAVYLEKPLATTMAAADRILTAAFESGSKLYVGHNMRHMSVVRMLRDIIGRGEIGEVKAIWCRHFVGNGGDYYFKDWHAERSRVNSLLLQKGAHDIDVIHWLAGAYTTEVTAMGDLMVYGDVDSRRDNSDRLLDDWFSHDNWPPQAQTDLNPVIDVEDISLVHMRLANGVLASYEQCHFTPDYWRNYTVIGTRGRAENFGDSAGGVIRVWNRRHEYQLEGDIEYTIDGDVEGHGGADELTMGEFIRFVRSGGATDTSPVAARQAVATGIMAAESLRDGSTPRVIPPVPDEVLRYFDDHQTPQSAPR
ncbi:Gfo/Idh/MocA family protein [Glaciibacter superstes]|uniref:Gfo/Idh/MocA family protein n=1 Tax=Glaciibacter superstes TaxID=501023 RepID=UPI000417508A|nr:Gfo/Idh/MocA family oxidoreductase [Glaciibacter superstes]